MKCTECGNPCKFLGHKIAIPRKRDDGAWKQLQEYVTQRHRSHSEERAKSNARRKHDIEHRINELQSRPQNEERDRLIKKLRTELDALPTP